jgi:predicted  nucleic acid-binding Zn-ribbon protein
MGATLDALQKLQEIDQQLRSTREQIESKKRSTRGAQRRVADLQRQIQDSQLQVKKTQAEVDRFELERQQHENHIGRLREALNRAKTNKEYAAILTELNTDKADAAKLEDAALAAMTRADEQRQAEQTLCESLDAAQARVQNLEQATAELEEQLSGRIAELEQERERAAEAIPPAVMEVFNRAADQNDGDAMAALKQTHPKRADYICSGCNMAVTLETINALQSNDSIQQCQTCLRILYLDVPAGAGIRR